MGQIKNIKLHIVTDIKIRQHEKLQQKFPQHRGVVPAMEPVEKVGNSTWEGSCVANQVLHTQHQHNFKSQGERLLAQLDKWVDACEIQRDLNTSEENIKPIKMKKKGKMKRMGVELLRGLKRNKSFRRRSKLSKFHFA